MKTSPIIAIQSPRPSEFDAIRRIICFGKKQLLVSISIFAPLIMADETDAEMVDVSNGGRRGRLLGVGVMAAASYFFPEIANYLQVQRTCKEERIGTDPC